MTKQLRLSCKLTIWDGDITKPDLGLSAEQRQLVCDKVSVIVHSASSINLRRPLQYMTDQVIEPSLAIGSWALSCKDLTRFVYISTAFSSVFLEESPEGLAEGSRSHIEEQIRDIPSNPPISAQEELANLKMHGTCSKYTGVRHPFSYTYAKNLAERLLLDLFSEAKREDTLTIFRPCCIGPAESRPYPFYEIPGSCPISIVLAGALALPPTRQRFSSHLADPSCATINEIPIDMVVNRLIAHAAFATSGCINATGGEACQMRITEFSQTAHKLRQFWWGNPTYRWTNDHWKSDKLSPLARLFVVFGCALTFSEKKTHLIWDRMGHVEQSKWPLYQITNLSTDERMAGREESLEILHGNIIKRAYGLPGPWKRIFLRRGGKKILLGGKLASDSYKERV